MTDVCAVNGDHPIEGSEPIVTLSHSVELQGQTVHIGYGLCDEHRFVSDDETFQLLPGKYYATLHVIPEDAS